MRRTGPLNSITDVPGIIVGCHTDLEMLSGVTVVMTTAARAVDKLRRKVLERGSRFVTTIYLREVITDPNWIDLGEDFTKEAAKLSLNWSS